MLQVSYFQNNFNKLGDFGHFAAESLDQTANSNKHRGRARAANRIAILGL
jgi:hypothetical protein